MQNGLVPTSSLNDFINHMANLESRDMKSTPRPMLVRLDGNTGIYMTSKWNDEEQKVEKLPFGVGVGFVGTVLANRYFVKSSFSPNAVKYHRTREFNSFSTDEIVLLEIEPKAEEKSKEIARFKDYYAFKEAMTTVNSLTKEENYNFDLFVSLYVYIHELDKVIVLESKGSSRTAWFDYAKSYRKGFPDVMALVQVKTEFAQQEEESNLKDEKGNVKKYFHTVLKTQTKNDEGELTRVMEATRSLFEWMSGWDRQNNSVEAKPIQAIPLNQPATEIDVLAALGPVDPQLAKDIANLPFNQS